MQFAKRWLAAQQKSAALLLGNALQVSGPTLVNISGIHASHTKKNFVAYATSETAPRVMTWPLAVDLVGLLHINARDTASVGTEVVRAGLAERLEALEQLEALHPVGRMGRPLKVASSALLLACESSGFINENCINVDVGIGSGLLEPIL